MARKKEDRIVVKLRSSESGHVYLIEKNKRNDPARLELRRFDPMVRRHVLYSESR